MIAVGQLVWWWDSAIGWWELHEVWDLRGDSAVLELRRGDGRRQRARKDLIPSATYRLADESEWANADRLDLTGRGEQLRCVA
ncbi:MAG: hypothetical protein WD810_03385 [Solirubrobacterales bacterium]